MMLKIHLINVNIYGNTIQGTLKNKTRKVTKLKFYKPM